MRKLRKLNWIVPAAVLMLTVLTVGNASAQKREYVQATAMGTSTQMGRMVSVNFIINEYSTAEDRSILMQAFTEQGSEGLVNALEKMNGKTWFESRDGQGASFFAEIPELAVSS